MGRVRVLVNEIRECLSELGMLGSDARNSAEGISAFAEKVRAVDYAFGGVHILDMGCKTALLETTPQLKGFCAAFYLIRLGVRVLCESVLLLVSGSSSGLILEWDDVIDAMSNLFRVSSSVREILVESDVIACSFCDCFAGIFELDYLKLQNECDNISSMVACIEGLFRGLDEKMGTFCRVLYRYAADDVNNDPVEMLYAEINGIVTALHAFNP